MQEDKNKVEAVLFTVGRFIGLEELSRLAGLGSIGYLRNVLNSLKEDYSSKDCSLELVQQGDKWKLSLRKEYLYLTENLLTDCELDNPTQETLAVIAFKSPVFQSEVVKIRGNGAYDHIKTLKELEFVTSEKSGRTRLLKVTSKFYDYFDVVEEGLKERLNIGKKEPEKAVDNIQADNDEDL